MKNKGVKYLLLKNKWEERLKECKQKIKELNEYYNIMVKHVEELGKYSHDLEKFKEELIKYTQMKKYELGKIKNPESIIGYKIVEERNLYIEYLEKMLIFFS